MIRVKLKRVAKDTWEATIVMQGDLVATHAKALATGPGAKATAVDRAAAIASQVASNPVLAAVLPPGTGAAIAATQRIANAAAAGAPLAEAVGRFTGTGAKRLAKALHLW